MPRVMIKGNTSAPAGGGGGNSNNLDASFRDMSYGNGGNAINNGDGTSAFASPPAASKEPKVYQFEPCLSFCCGRFNHVRGVAAVSVAGTVGAGAVVGGCLYSLTKLEESWMPLTRDQLIIISCSFSLFLMVNVLLLSGVITWRRNLFCPWMIMVFPMNLFLFGSIFYLVYKIIAGSDDEEELEGASEQSTVEETGEGDKEGDVVENVKSKIPGLKYLLVALAVIGLVLNWYFWSLIWSLYIRMGKGCSAVHQLETPPRKRRRTRRSRPPQPQQPPPQPPQQPPQLPQPRPPSSSSSAGRRRPQQQSGEEEDEERGRARPQMQADDGLSGDVDSQQGGRGEEGGKAGE